ncbi:MAG: hypothetical protein N4A63_04275 [Vallitalea sp.]|jgi:hypothetical protein|nr:hypothetical protein [Vallitalea sp.]
MITDFKLLKQNGGPFPLLKQIGYGSYYLVAKTMVSESATGYNFTKITFENSAGSFIPSQPIFLTPQNPIAKNIDLTSAHMKLHIDTIQLNSPTPEQDGEISIVCHFTDINGSNNQDFTGPIAIWTSEGPKK